MLLIPETIGVRIHLTVMSYVVTFIRSPESFEKIAILELEKPSLTIVEFDEETKIASVTITNPSKENKTAFNENIAYSNQSDVVERFIKPKSTLLVENIDDANIFTRLGHTVNTVWKTVPPNLELFPDSLEQKSFWYYHDALVCVKKDMCETSNVGCLSACERFFSVLSYDETDYK